MSTPQQIIITTLPIPLQPPINHQVVAQTTTNIPSSIKSVVSDSISTVTPNAQIPQTTTNNNFNINTSNTNIPPPQHPVSNITNVINASTTTRAQPPQKTQIISSPQITTNQNQQKIAPPQQIQQFQQQLQQLQQQPHAQQQQQPQIQQQLQAQQLAKELIPNPNDKDSRRLSSSSASTQINNSASSSTPKSNSLSGNTPSHKLLAIHHSPYQSLSNDNIYRYLLDVPSDVLIDCLVGESIKNDELFSELDYYALSDPTKIRIFIRDLNYDTTKETLGNAFKRFGKVIDSTVIYDKTNNRSKGYGFITFSSSLEAAEACRQGQLEVDGRRTQISLATPLRNKSHRFHSSSDRDNRTANNTAGDRDYRHHRSGANGAAGGGGVRSRSRSRSKDRDRDNRQHRGGHGHRKDNRGHHRDNRGGSSNRSNNRFNRNDQRDRNRSNDRNRNRNKRGNTSNNHRYGVIASNVYSNRQQQPHPAQTTHNQQIPTHTAIGNAAHHMVANPVAAMPPYAGFAYPGYDTNYTAAAAAAAQYAQYNPVAVNAQTNATAVTQQPYNAAAFNAHAAAQQYAAYHPYFAQK